MAKSNIDWTDYVWNPVTGCTPISAGCQNCYAKRMAETRLRGHCGYRKEDPFGITVHHNRLKQPQEWKRPRKIFVCSMGDLFHSGVPIGFRYLVLAKIRDNPRHTFILLTKRPGIMRDVIVGFKSFSPIWPYKIDSQGDKHLLQCLPNLWLGVTAENQAAANERIPILLDIPAAKRFVSVEPMLEKIDITPFVGPYDCMACGYVGAESARDEEAENDDEDMACPECGASENCGGFGFLESNPDVNGERINWVIAGAETGPGARPMNPEWARSLRDQCQAAEVLFFFKSWGEYMPFDFSYGKWCRWKDKKDPARYQLDGKIYREWPT